MVLDSKAFDWASEQGLDTAALKQAKVPVYGKWYFPDLPADTPLVNLHTGAIESFGTGFRAGSILYVKEEDLRKSRLGPFKMVEPSDAEPTTGVAYAPVTTPITSAEVDAGTVAAAAPIAVMQRTHTPEEPYELELDQPVGHDAPGMHDELAEHPHPSAQKYVVIAAILAIITAMEVAVYYIDLLQAIKPVFVMILLVLSVIKFALVVGFFMHLKFDPKLYTGLFGGGLAIAVSIVTALILLFMAWQPIPTPALPGMPAPGVDSHSAPATGH